MANRRKAVHKPTKKGHIRICVNGKLVFEHVFVWEKHYGKIPKGYQVHHKDRNPANNDINNLQLVTPLEHKRIHEGCILKEGEWLKPCSVCGEYKPTTKDYWYFSRGTINGTICKRCFIDKSLRLRKEREARGWKRKQYNKA